MNRKFFILIVVAISTVFVICSCQSFHEPEGPPPSGPIVTTPERVKQYQPDAALNYMSTSLTAACLNNFRPGQTVLCSYDFKSCDNNFSGYPLRTMNSIRDLITFCNTENADIKLFSRIEANKNTALLRWDMRLSAKGKTLWQDQVMIESKQKEKIISNPPEPKVIPPPGFTPEPTVITPLLRTGTASQKFVPTVPRF